MNLLIIGFFILHAYHAAPGGDDAVIAVPGGVRSYTSKPIAFVTSPGFEVQTVCGLLPDSTYEGWRLLPRTERIGTWTCPKNGCIRFLTVGQAIIMVQKVPAR